jgi:hypothetical protein
MLPPIDWDNVTQEEEEAAFKVIDNHPATLFRNYALFAILADVRNTFGVIPISSPKGIPRDTSETVILEFESHEEVHSASWLSLKEIIDFNWRQIITDSRYGQTTTCEYATEPFTTKTIPYLESLVNDPINLRIVFWFNG